MSVDQSSPRTTLRRLADERGSSLSALSRMLGRNAAYLSRYVGRGTPRHLADRDRQLLAAFFDVNPYLFAEPERRPGPPDRDQVQGLATKLGRLRGDRGVSNAQLAAAAIRWLHDDGGLR